MSTAAVPLIITADEIRNQAPESFDCPTRGHGLSWKTLLSASKTATDTLTAGIATCAPGKSYLCSHRHKHPEIYHIISGEGVVEIDGTEHLMEPGSVAFIPSDARHGMKNASPDFPLVWFYAFAADDFGEVVYKFGDDATNGTALES